MSTEASPQMRRAIGVTLGLAGLALFCKGALDLTTAADPLQGDLPTEVLIGGCVLFAGVTFTLPNVVGFRQRLFQALTVTCLALAFDWVAFGPGERVFRVGASAGHAGGAVDSGFGRAAFGVGTVLMDLVAIWMWRLAVRLARTGRETP